MNDTLLNLPWVIQLSLVSGYAAYVLSYFGIRAKHSATDIIFITLSFGLIASGICFFFKINDHVFPVSLLAFIVTCAVGVMWRKYIRDFIRNRVRDADVSWSDDDPSALTSIAYDSQYKLSQLSVETDDGKTFLCNSALEFVRSPFGPCRIGVDGDIAMYVTHIRNGDEPPEEQPTVKDAEYGDRITYIPASKIKRVSFRHLP